MISNLGKWAVRIAAVAGAASVGAAPAQAAGPQCGTQTRTFPYQANFAYQVTESEMLRSCYDADGDTLHIISPSMPYYIYLYPQGGMSPAGPFVHTVSDGHGNTTTMTLQINRSYGP